MKNLANKKPFVVWFLGLSGSGKTALAMQLKKKLNNSAITTVILDGDQLRKGVNVDLGFNDEDRKENLRRALEIALILTEQNFNVIAAFITPFEEDRQIIRKSFKNTNFIEVYVSTPLSICEQRDSKKLYQSVRAGNIKNFTGISSNFEVPKNPHLVIDNSIFKPEIQSEIIFNYMLKNRYI